MKRKKLADKPKKIVIRSLRDLDGRTASARAAMSLRDALANDLGGLDSLTAAKLQIVTNAAVLGAMLQDIATKFIGGESVDCTSFSTLANSQRRLLSDLGLDRRAKDVTPDLESYVKGRTI